MTFYQSFNYSTVLELPYVMNRQVACFITVHIMMKMHIHMTKSPGVLLTFSFVLKRHVILYMDDTGERIEQATLSEIQHLFVN